MTWNFRGPAAERAPLSPSERRDSIELVERVKVVSDSLVGAGWEEEPLRRMVGLFTGETDREQFFGSFGGGGGGGPRRDPEVFQERAGESGAGARGGGAGGFDFNRLRELASLVSPGAGMGAFFGRGGQQAPVAEPGTYTLTLKVGERSHTRALTVERASGTGGGGSPFVDETPDSWQELLAWLEATGR